MSYRFLADAVLVIHLLFIAFAVTGGFAVLRFGWMALAHLPACAWVAYIELSGGLCPLTTLENAYRRIAGEAGYADSFVDHYLVPIIYPAGLTRDIQFWLAGGVIAINAIAYGCVVYRRPMARRRNRRST